MLVAYQRSGLSPREFAVETGMGYSTLTRWLRQGARARRSVPPAFVPVPNLFSGAAPLPAYRLMFPQGVRVEVASGFRSEELGALLQRVRAL